MASRQSAFRSRDFRLLFVGAGISYVGSSFTAVAAAFGVLELTGSTTAVGVVVGARELAQVALLLVGGAWADRVSRRAQLVTCYVGSGTTQALIAVLLLTRTGTLTSIAVLAAVNGAVSAFQFPAFTGLVPEVVPAPARPSANASLSIVRSSATIGGAAVAGALVAAAGAGWAIAVDGATYFVGALLLSRIHPTPTGRGSERGAGLVAELREGWQEFVARRWVWAIVAQFSVLVMGYTAAIDVLAPVIAQTDYDSAAAYGLAMSGVAVGGLLGGVAMLRFRPHRPMLVATLAMLLTVLVFAAFALGLPLWSVVALAVVSGASLEVFSVLWTGALQAHIPADRMSRVSSYDAFGSMSLAPLGAVLAGPVASALGSVHAAMWVAVGVAVVPTLAVLCLPDVWRMTDAPVTRPTG